MMATAELIKGAQVTRQLYGIAVAGGSFGGPRGIWLECTACPESHVICGSAGVEWSKISDDEAADVFRRHGWSGSGGRMLKAKCPKCSAA